MTGHCNLCHEDVPTLDLVEHIRLFHPDWYSEPSGVVTISCTLSPDQARAIQGLPASVFQSVPLPRRKRWWRR